MTRGVHTRCFGVVVCVCGGSRRQLLSSLCLAALAGPTETNQKTDETWVCVCARAHVWANWCLSTIQVDPTTFCSESSCTQLILHTFLMMQQSMYHTYVGLVLPVCFQSHVGTSCHFKWKRTCCTRSEWGGGGGEGDKVNAVIQIKRFA